MRIIWHLTSVILILCVSIAEAQTVNYDGKRAIIYASGFCGAENSGTSYNPNYKRWTGDSGSENPGGGKVDCANFVSQSLIYGGLDFDNYPNYTEIGEGTNKAGGFPGVEKLRDALVMGYCFGMITDPSQAQPVSCVLGSHLHMSLFS